MEAKNYWNQGARCVELKYVRNAWILLKESVLTAMRLDVTFAVITWHPERAIFVVSSSVRIMELRKTSQRFVMSVGRSIDESGRVPYWA